MLFVCLFLSVAGFSQSRSINVDISAEKMAKLYDLSDTQKAQCLQFLKDKLSAIQALDNNPNTVENIQKQRLEIDKSFNDNFEKILNPEQAAIFQKHRKIAEQPKAVKEAIKYTTSEKDSGKHKVSKQ